MSAPGEQSHPYRVPAPPGGHPLRIDRAGRRPRRLPGAPRTAASELPVVDEVSAGGIVVAALNGEVHVAVIGRRNRGGRLEWCLPKGHLEGTETAEQAAVREVAEETGVRGVIARTLGTVDYWFTGDDHRVHKVVHHYLLTAVGGRLTVTGDPDAEAEVAAWIRLGDLPERLSYPNERRIASLARHLRIEADAWDTLRTGEDDA